MWVYVSIHSVRVKHMECIAHIRWCACCRLPNCKIQSILCVILPRAHSLCGCICACSCVCVCVFVCKREDQTEHMWRGGKGANATKTNCVRTNTTYNWWRPIISYSYICIESIYSANHTDYFELTTLCLRIGYYVTSSLKLSTRVTAK